MRPYIHEDEKHLFVPNLIYQEQVAFYVTFPVLPQFAAQPVISVLGRQFLALGKGVNGFLQVRLSLPLKRT